MKTVRDILNESKYTLQLQYKSREGTSGISVTINNDSPDTVAKQIQLIQKTNSIKDGDIQRVDVYNGAVGSRENLKRTIKGAANLQKLLQKEAVQYAGDTIALKAADNAQKLVIKHKADIKSLAESLQSLKRFSPDRNTDKMIDQLCGQLLATESTANKIIKEVINFAYSPKS